MFHQDGPCSKHGRSRTSCRDAEPPCPSNPEPTESWSTTDHRSPKLKRATKIDGTWTTDRCRAQIAPHAQSQRSGSPRPPGDVTAARGQGHRAASGRRMHGGGGVRTRRARLVPRCASRPSPPARVSPTASFSCGGGIPPDSSVSPPPPRRIVQAGLLSCEVGSGGRHRCLLLPADRPPPIPSRSFLQRSFKHATPAGHSRHAREATGPVSQPKEWLARGRRSSVRHHGTVGIFLGPWGRPDWTEEVRVRRRLACHGPARRRATAWLPRNGMCLPG